MFCIIIFIAHNSTTTTVFWARSSTWATQESRPSSLHPSRGSPTRTSPTTRTTTLPPMALKVCVYCLVDVVVLVFVLWNRFTFDTSFNWTKKGSFWCCHCCRFRMIFYYIYITAKKYSNHQQTQQRQQVVRRSVPTTRWVTRSSTGSHARMIWVWMSWARPSRMISGPTLYSTIWFVGACFWAIWRQAFEWFLGIVILRIFKFDVLVYLTF